MFSGVSSSLPGEPLLYSCVYTFSLPPFIVLPCLLLSSLFQSIFTCVFSSSPPPLLFLIFCPTLLFFMCIHVLDSASSSCSSSRIVGALLFLLLFPLLLQTFFASSSALLFFPLFAMFALVGRHPDFIRCRAVIIRGLSFFILIQCFLPSPEVPFVGRHL